MTAPVTAPKTTPPTPEPSVAAQAAASVAAAKTGPAHRWTRPFRYTFAFIDGTIRESLNGFARWGGKGLKWGALAGVGAWMYMGTVGASLVLGGPVGAALAIASGGSINALIAGVMAFTLGTFAVASAVGATYGFLTGGVQAVGRMHRGEVYAEDLIVRSKIQQAAPPNRADYRQKRREKVQQANEVSQYLLERQKEAAADSATYWQDREHRSSGNSQWHVL